MHNGSSPPSTPTTKLRRAISLFLPRCCFPSFEAGPHAPLELGPASSYPPAELLHSTPSISYTTAHRPKGTRDPLARGLVGGTDFTVQVGWGGDVSGPLVKALMAKPSPLSPLQPQLVSPPPSSKESGEVRAGSFATSSSSGTLGDTHPFTTKKGSSMDMASRPPAASRLLHAQGARALRSSLRPPDWPPAAAGASAWGT